jgi:hypothetical protein
MARTVAERCQRACTLAAPDEACGARRECELVKQRAKQAGHSFSELQRGVQSGHVTLRPLPDVAGLQAGLRKMLLGVPVSPNGGGGRAERAANRNS